MELSPPGAGQILKIIHHRPASAVTFNQSGRYG